MLILASFNLGALGHFPSAPIDTPLRRIWRCIAYLHKFERSMPVIFVVPAKAWA